MSRDTCIWETPTRTPISDCVRSSSKRRRRTSRSRSVSTRISRSTVAASSATEKPGSSMPTESAMPAAVLVLVVARAVERDRPVGARGLAGLEHLLGGRADRLGDLGRRRARGRARGPSGRRRGRP